MRAKFINEIVRGRESAISALGIGKNLICPGYGMTQTLYPSILAEFSDYSTFMKHDEISVRANGNEIEKLFRLIGKDVNDAIWANRESLQEIVGDVQTFKNVWYPKSELVTLNNDNFRIYYNTHLKMGTFIWSDYADDVIAEHFFIIVSEL